MDPLSVAASVTGLLGVGVRISSSLFSLITACRDAPNLAQSLMWEVTDISAILGHLQSYILGRTRIATSRASMIMVEHLLTTLTGCVATYSDLQRVLEDLNLKPEMNVFDKIKWARSESLIHTIVRRLQHQKSSMSLMLTIIQWCVVKCASSPLSSPWSLN
jgi:hypothetical protein